MEKKEKEKEKELPYIFATDDHSEFYIESQRRKEKERDSNMERFEIDTAELPKSMGFPKGMNGVTLNLETLQYE